MTTAWRARALINTAAFAHNLQRVKTLAPHSNVMAVVKASAYGHSVEAIASQLSAADALAVIDVAEAHALRQFQTDSPIVILQGCSTTADAEWCVSNNASPVVVEASQLGLLLPLAAQYQQLWLKLDSGMHRLGLTQQDALSAAAKLREAGFNGQLGLMTHFACADDDAAFTQQQIDCFDQAVASDDFQFQSLANSAAIFNAADSHRDYVRPGIMLYGASPFADQSAQSLGLKPVMSFQSKVAAIHTVPAGEGVGYGLIWKAQQPTQVVVISAGYGDGVPRNLAAGTAIAVGEHIGRLVGRVSMDSCFVAFESAVDIAVGDIATLWGETQGGQLLPVDNAASASGTIAYELLCRVAPRVQRFAVASVSNSVVGS